jgi:hypothetical protein
MHLCKVERLIKYIYVVHFINFGCIYGLHGVQVTLFNVYGASMKKLNLNK